MNTKKAINNYMRRFTLILAVLLFGSYHASAQKIGDICPIPENEQKLPLDFPYNQRGLFNSGQNNIESFLTAGNSELMREDEKPSDNQMSREDMLKSMEDLQNRVAELSERVDKLEQKTDDRLNLKISGFFDVNISNYQNKPNVFDIGSFELDMIHTYQKNLQVAAALVFDEGAELGVGFIDYHLFGGTISPRGRLYAEKGIHLQVGKFDVPFGNDWQYFAAPQMVSVTAPLTTEVIMDGGYNDVGVRLLSNFVSTNFTLYMLRGIDRGYSYGGNSYGGRVGLTPFSTPYQLRAKAKPELDVGFSYIADLDKGGQTAETLIAFDIESTVGMFNLRSEYFERDKKVGILYKGFHVTGAVDFGLISPIPVVLFGRYEYVLTERYEIPKGKNPLKRAATGINVNIYNISSLKFEYQNYLEVYDDYMEEEYFNDQLYFLQLIITF